MLAVCWLDSSLEGLYTVFNLAESSEETSKQEDLVMMWPTSLDWPTAKEWRIAWNTAWDKWVPGSKGTGFYKTGLWKITAVQHHCCSPSLTHVWNCSGKDRGGKTKQTNKKRTTTTKNKFSSFCVYKDIWRSHKIIVFQITMQTWDLHYTFVCTDILSGFWQYLAEKSFSAASLLISVDLSPCSSRNNSKKWNKMCFLIRVITLVVTSLGNVV